MQMVQFLSTLQEAPRVFSDAISEACTTYSWEIFCYFPGRILGGTVSTDIGVSRSCILFGIFFPLYTFLFTQHAPLQCGNTTC
jgi:RNA 3'-terminal phosphate cyclase